MIKDKGTDKINEKKRVFLVRKTRFKKSEFIINIKKIFITNLKVSNERKKHFERRCRVAIYLRISEFIP